MKRLALPFAALLACGSCATVPASDAAVQSGARYVAMGSSFAAGAGIGPLKQGSPERCGRTTNNYAALLAADLGLDLVDASCGGATTAHLLGRWNELPAQLDAVTADTRLVTITVGGNDLDYMGLLFTASCDPAVGMMFDGQRVPCQPVAPPMPSEADYEQLEAALAAIANRVRMAAPEAMVIFVQYVSLVPEQLCDATPLDADDGIRARHLAARLAEVTAGAAEQTGALVLPADTLSASHTACDTEAWSRGFPADPEVPGAPWHPTAAGHAAIAAELARILSEV